MIRNEIRFRELHAELVPASGKASSLAGEMLRAVGQLMYRSYNDGDMVGEGWGKETCNPAARFLKICGTGDVSVLARSLFVIDDEDVYDGVLEMLVDAVVRAVDEKPELRETETQDMYDYYDEVSDTWED